MADSTIDPSKRVVFICRKSIRVGCGHARPIRTYSLPHRRERPNQVLRQSCGLDQQRGVFSDRRSGMRARRRRQLLGKFRRRSETELRRLHGVQPLVVPQRSVRSHDRRRGDQQPWALSGSVAPNQRRYGGFRYALFHAKSR